MKRQPILSVIVGLLLGAGIWGCASSGWQGPADAEQMKDKAGKGFFRVSATKALERNPSAVPAKSGSFIVAFEAEPSDAQGDVDLYAQRISGTGDLMWDAAVPVATAPAREEAPQLIPDGHGGAFVVFSVTYMEGEHAGDRDIAAQRITAAGDLLWEEGIRSVIVSGSKAIEKQPVVISDEQGGIVVAFERKYLEGENRGDVDVFAQRLSPEGKKLWRKGAASMPVSNTRYLERAPAMVGDGAGGFLVVNELEARTGKRAGDVELVAQRLNDSGERIWQDGQEPVIVSQAPLAERNPAAVSDGAGGMIVSFELAGLKGENRGRIDIGAQRIDANGVICWNAADGYVSVASDRHLQERAPVVISGRERGAVIIWQAAYPAGRRKGDMDLYAQYFSGRGEALWHMGKRAAALAISEAVERDPAVLRLPDGSVMVACEKQPAASGNTHPGRDIRLKRLCPAGRVMWHKDLAVDGSAKILADLKNPALAVNSSGRVAVFFEAAAGTAKPAAGPDIYARVFEYADMGLW